LKEKYAEAKSAGTIVNECREKVNFLKKTIEQLRVERALHVRRLEINYTYIYRIVINYWKNLEFRPRRDERGSGGGKIEEGNRKRERKVQE
jgi:hypothetical protein